MVQPTLRMEITSIGHSSFKFRGKNATVVTDPYDPKVVGLKFPKIQADVVTISHEHADHNNRADIEGEPLIISGAGEYEAKGVKVMGLDTYHDNTNGKDRGGNVLYKIEIDGVSIVHAGDLGHKLAEAQLDMLGDVGVLLIPVGGKYTIDAGTAVEIISQMAPKIVIPMHYKQSGLTAEFDELTGIDVFLKEMGKESIPAVAKLTVSPDRLPAETTVVIFS